LNKNYYGRGKISSVREIEFSADQLITALLKLSEQEAVCLLDSCGVSYLNSHLLIAGIKPRETFEITNKDVHRTLEFLDDKFSNSDLAYIFSISYEFGLKLENIEPRPKEFPAAREPDVFLAAFDCLIVHDYDTGATCLTGNEKRFDEIERILRNLRNTEDVNFEIDLIPESNVSSNFTCKDYIQTIEKIQEHIRRGDTYQTNLTQQLRAELPENLNARKIFRRLRKNHPAPFAAFLKRENDYVVSISPERFVKIQNSSIEASPIKGTRPRGITPEEDLQLRKELLSSEKDLAENVMIVDLLRNDIGRICRFGSVKIEKLCDLETHPTLYHLVSTVRGELRENIEFSDILKAVFPCGSITGAPKIRTMRIIDELETAPRGLSMGAIGYSIQSSKFNVQNSIDLNVAIRTMVVKDNEAIFNVGGGIVIDSVPDLEYEETLVKARALLKVLGADEKQLYK